MTELVARHVDIGAVAALAGATVTADPWRPADAVGDAQSADEQVAGPVVAVAAGQGVQLRLPRAHRAAGRCGGTRRSRSTRSPMRCRTAPRHWCCPADSPSSTPPSCRPMIELRQQICALADTGRPCTPSARA